MCQSYGMVALRFIIYGLLGWCVEILWTALYDFFAGLLSTRSPSEYSHRWRLTGQTYLWMLPIYGIGGLLLEQVHLFVNESPFWLRGGIYCLLCFAVEYTSGWVLRRTVGRCPWDYSACWLHIHGLIRPDYALAWALLGLGFERLHNTLLQSGPCIYAALMTNQCLMAPSP